jgi:hypothetical protein
MESFSFYAEQCIWVFYPDCTYFISDSISDKYPSDEFFQITRNVEAGLPGGDLSKSGRNKHKNT